MADKWTKRQQAVMDSIEKSIREKGYGPTVREICADLGLSSPSTVHVHLKTLEQKGYIAARDEPSAAGRPRRYYHLTDAGRRRLCEKEAEWNAYTRAVGKVLKGGAYGG